MFVFKTKKSAFYQLTYEINGKRTTVSTKTTYLKEANTFIVNFAKIFDGTKIQSAEPDKISRGIILS